MKGFIWKIKAYRYMRSRVGWARLDMVSSLYDTFGDWSPEEAVEEDISYWF